MTTIIIPVEFEATEKKVTDACLITSISWRQILPFIHQAIRIGAHEAIVGLEVTEEGITVKLKSQ